MSVETFSQAWFRDMLLATIGEPRRAARELLEIRLPDQALWTWLGLASVLNGLVYSLTVPPQVQVAFPMPGLLQSPILLSLVMGVLMVGMTQFFVWAGRLLGGSSDFRRMLQLTCWLQTLRVLFQVVISLVSMLSIGLSGLLAVIGGFWGVYILANFIAEAHRFTTPIKAVATLIIGVLGVAFAMTFLLALLGLAPTETI
ncbi:Yip1 family protein [Pseudooceanicola sp.]|uniref:Yip1 family protein n=1 Tax=Pseudooceanicola sp. TaxID=1914328 RepID=UPI0026090FC2|nr:Yip1 family protein [Pseudooceanicola sp.]MDF1855782.1 Yip1 family protein [Pseudooceanicola sp.]